MAKIISLSHENASLDSKEWLITAGNGTYAGLSIEGKNLRKHHALLNASLLPPVKRVQLLHNIEEYANGLPISYTDVSIDGSVTYRLVDSSLEIHKTIDLVYGKNTLAILYEISTKDQATNLTFIPQFQYRDHSDVSKKSEMDLSIRQDGQVLVLMKNSQEVLYFSMSDGDVFPNVHEYVEELSYPIDKRTGDDRKDVVYTPIRLEISIPPFSTRRIEILASTSPIEQTSAVVLLSESKKRRDNLLLGFSQDTELMKRLVLSADNFIVNRQSTGLKSVIAGYPWFTDWGRDTMIAFEGLFLVTKRYEEGKEVLRSFAKYVKNGLIPNMFPDMGEDALYNTVDASLWYLVAIDKYVRQTEDYAFLEEIYPTMKDIVSHYMEGTDFSIGMDVDGLIHAGSGLDQVTWMDVRINGEVITPRHGKPVEINALWYHDLVVMSKWSKSMKDDEIDYKSLSQTVRKSFLKKFVQPNRTSLFDVVDEFDSSIRPNMVIAASLEYSPIPTALVKKIIITARRELLDLYGLRSLSKNDPRFIPTYEGDIVKRDHAYHMGTTWGFLLGFYVDALMKTNNRIFDPVKKEVLSIVKRVEEALDLGCINGIAEIFDGLNGDKSKGCYSQAWSVSSALTILHHCIREGWI